MNVVLSVEALEETVIVSGAAPLVDVQSVLSERQLSAELLEALPASRSPQGFAALTQGLSAQVSILSEAAGRNESLEPRFARPGIALSDRRT